MATAKVRRTPEDTSQPGGLTPIADDDRRVDRGDVYQGFLYAFAYARPAAGTPPSLILYPATSGSAGFRLAIQNTSGLRGARIAGLPIDIQRTLQRHHIGAEDGTLLLAEDDPLATLMGMIVNAG